ncbi:thiolase family protein [Caballeronia sp. dw_19]|uniref:thiolase family protein n=1 Tax=Caballeronia sp. dw_19 TaxID=2719791 RepID=UPI001BD2D2DB|nr:thiolase family protein [Caballeronia sp. dw_19]
MNANNLRGKAAIVGFGDSYCKRGEAKSAMRLAQEATRRALDDAGLAKEEIDGLLTGRAPMSDQRHQWNNIFAAYNKITPRYSSEITIHAAGMNSMLKHAALAVTSGVARFVLCVGADAVASLPTARAQIGGMDADPEFEQPYEPIIPTIYAQMARRLMHEYDLTEADFSAVSVQCQEWAVHHPYAAKAHKGLVTIDDVMRSPMIASPLRLWHCAPWGPPGTAGAVIVTDAQTARSMSERPLYLLGAGECQTHEYLTDRMALRHSRLPLGNLPNITSTGCRAAAETAYEMAGLHPNNIDIVQTASQFAHVELQVLAELGFTDLREAGEFVRSGATGPSGTLPTNTNGGWLSFGQPGVSCVMDSISETIRQLRGEALGLQVEGADIGLVHGNGGMQACHSIAILGREP